MSNKYFFQGSGSGSSEFSGPLQKRSCGDVMCLLVFLAVLGGTGFGGYLGVRLGDPNRLVYGVDSWGNVCSKQNGRIDGVLKSGKDCTNLR